MDGTRPGQQRCKLSQSLVVWRPPSSIGGCFIVNPSPLVGEGGKIAVLDDVRLCWALFVILAVPGLVRRKECKAHKAQATSRVCVSGPRSLSFLISGTLGGLVTRPSAHAMASSLLTPARTIRSLPSLPNWSPTPPRGSAAAGWPVHRWIIRATQGSSGSPPAAKERKRCLPCGGMYLDEENHPNACAFHSHVTGISSRVFFWYGDLGLPLIPCVGMGLPP
jgi:hypothetical protein